MRRADQRHRGDAGFVLLNALVTVAGLAVVAATLLSVSARGTGHLMDSRLDHQLASYLDGGTLLVARILEEDHEDDGAMDHLGEVWATEGYSAPIHLGQLSGRIEDAQGRFNLNWLTKDTDGFAAGALQRLVQDAGLPIALAGAIQDTMRPGGPTNASAYANRDIPLAVPGGAIADLSPLRAVPGMTEAHLNVLLPLIAALPATTALNINTAPAPVLTALFPGAGPSGAAQIIAARQSDPFSSRVGFRRRMGHLLPSEGYGGIPADLLDVKSAWFTATLYAELDGARRGREVVFFRASTTGTAMIRRERPLP